MSNSAQPLDVIICGGSLSALVAGILLKRRGHNTTILESTASSQRSGLAAGIGLGGNIKSFFEHHDRCSGKPLGVVNDGFSVLDDNLNVKYKLGVSMNLTSWDAAYYRCRANYDGFRSDYVCETPSVEDGEGSATYLTGKRVLRVEEGAGGKVVVVVEDVGSEMEERYEGDFVIGADGANSVLRKQLQGTPEREEPGYLIWRGTIPTKELSQEVRGKIENKPIIWTGPQTYAVIYTIPGENGSLVQDERHINMAWYFWPDKASLKEIMTDVDGHLHRSTVPKGKMRPEVWQPQIEQAHRLLPKELVALVERIEKPFVSVISSIAPRKAVHLNDRVFLIGEALAQAQPNTGQGTNLVALAAMTLVHEVIAPTDGLDTSRAERAKTWERKLIEETEVARLASIAFGSWYLSSWPMIAWYYARFQLKAYMQYWLGTRDTPYSAVGRK